MTKRPGPTERRAYALAVLKKARIADHGPMFEEAKQSSGAFGPDANRAAWDLQELEAQEKARDKLIEAGKKNNAAKKAATAAKINMAEYDRLKRKRLNQDQIAGRLGVSAPTLRDWRRANGR